MVVEANTLVFNRCKQEITRSLRNTVLIVDVADGWELLLAETAINNILVVLVASREEHEDWSLVCNRTPDSLEL